MLVALAFWIGYRRGLTRVVGPVLGGIVGVVAARYLGPAVIIRLTSPADVAARAVLLTGAFGVLPVLGATAASVLFPARHEEGAAPLGRLAGGVAAVAVLGAVVWILAPMSERQEAYVAWSAGSATAELVEALPEPPVDIDGLIAEGVLPPRLADLLGQPERGPAPTEPAPLAPGALDRLRAASVQLFVFSCGRPATGSGFAVADGIIATNAHVVQGTSEPVEVVATDGRTASGTVVLYDEARDLALVSVSGLELPPLPLAGDEAGAGDLVTTAGHPRSDRELHVAPARVEAIGFVGFTTDQVGVPTTRRLYTLTSADVERGSSGGAVVDASGAVVGVVFAGREEEDLAFATAVSEIRSVLDAHGTEAAPTGSC